MFHLVFLLLSSPCRNIWEFMNKSVFLSLRPFLISSVLIVLFQSLLFHIKESYPFVCLGPLSQSWLVPPDPFGITDWTAHVLLKRHTVVFTQRWNDLKKKKRKKTREECIVLCSKPFGPKGFGWCPQEPLTLKCLSFQTQLLSLVGSLCLSHIFLTESHLLTRFFSSHNRSIP